MFNKKKFPKNPRPKLPLSVNQQRDLLKGDLDFPKALIRMILSTGMHPCVFERPDQYGITWNDKYYTWVRPKNNKAIQGNWSKAMQEPGILDILKTKMKRSREWYFMIVRDRGKEVGIKGLCPLQLRHAYFVNRARLGHNAFDISHGAGTGMDVIYKHYTIGMGESKSLSQEDRGFLEWLMET